MKSFVIQPVFVSSASEDTPLGAQSRALGEDNGARLSETCRLAATLGAPAAASEKLLCRRIDPATFLGKGKIAAVLARIDSMRPRPKLLVFDGKLTQKQQYQLEKALSVRVLDRIGMILEIFSARARTKEGVLQVELARLGYARSRLVRSWTHLERQRGASGFVAGPGESQLETDRRLLDERIRVVKKRLGLVRRHRAQQRKNRLKVPYATAAIVGYTNAGKSSLFNRLTGASSEVADRLFATLDPKSRVVELPGKEGLILIDTVGFISDLPTLLVDAFHATLEEAVLADIILHIRDASSPTYEQQKEDVLKVLHSLGIDEAHDKIFCELTNKIDLYKGTPKSENIEAEGSWEDPLRLNISAHSGEGLESFLETLCRILERKHRFYLYRIDFQKHQHGGEILAYLHRHAHIYQEYTQGGCIFLGASLTPERVAYIKKRFDVQPSSSLRKNENRNEKRIESQ